MRGKDDDCVGPQGRPKRWYSSDEKSDKCLNLLSSYILSGILGLLIPPQNFPGLFAVLVYLINTSIVTYEVCLP